MPPSFRSLMSRQLAVPLPSCEYFYAFPLRRYRLRVRTRPSQGRNPGSNPGIATNRNHRFTAPPPNPLSDRF